MLLPLINSFDFHILEFFCFFEIYKGYEICKGYDSKAGTENNSPDSVVLAIYQVFHMVEITANLHNEHFVLVRGYNLRNMPCKNRLPPAKKK